MQIINFLSLAFLLSNINALYLSAEQHPITPPSSPLLPPSQKQSISQPLIGFGTWNLNLSPGNTTEAVAYAIEIGYRQIDCAAAYGNEVAVGQGIKEGLKRAGLKREDIWVTSKLWNDHHGSHENVEKGLNQTLQDLDLEYLDLYLIHWPIGFSSNGTKNLDHVQTYKSMISLPKSRVLNIGVSNFSPLQLKNVVSTGTMPYTHQMELHPYLQQSAWVATHKALGIKMTAYSPLGNTNPTYHSSPSTSLSSSSSSSSSWTSWTSLFRPSSSKPRAPPLLQNPILLDIAEQRNCTPAQVALKWNMGRGISVIPKSSHEEWIKENLHAEECELTHADLTKLRFVGRKWLSRFNNPGKEWGVTLFEGLEGV
ncbi:putative aldehyde reductase protein [Botrytis fragariae]|uniref:Putative aldehyde reductase protein n=1 Tax=Botrytis fragariae TaxID=1964551 RepID=A0A8H6AJA4_9HELO|nr:putative aldehyde reductase protein [Botrytis fragariae]KAF5868326.1 putative aldehyde reductase protein [Botrytis fragariae]